MGTHTSFVSLLNKLQPSNYIKMFKLFAVAAGIASASAGYAGLYPAAGLGYGYGLAAPAYAAAPLAAAPLAAAPVLANKYAVPTNQFNDRRAFRITSLISTKNQIVGGNDIKRTSRGLSKKLQNHHRQTKKRIGDNNNNKRKRFFCA